jgi:phosphatidylinositol-bisphosphatase
VIDEGRYHKVYEEEVRRLDKMENDFLPSVELDQQSLDFGTVKFQRPRNCSLKVSNTGQYPCRYEFIAKGDDKSFCPPWLTINKPKGILTPGEHIMLEFEVYVNQTTAPSLNTGEERLEDILILHLVGGKDFFITVNGEYLPSCIGTSFTTPCLMNKPIQHTDMGEIKRMNALSANHIRRISTPMLAIPKELWKLMDHLYHHGKQQSELFQRPALHTEVQEVIEHLDSCLPTVEDPLPGSNHCVAETLLILLSAAPEPVIPYKFYEMCTSTSMDHPTAIQLLSSCQQCTKTPSIT